MARYLTINSQFNPISFEEMIKPAILYKEEYERQQDALDELSKNSVLSQLSNSSIDSNVYKAYQSYMNGVNNAADKLMDTGKLDSNAIRKLRKNYNEIIAPYENKFKNRAARIEEQRKNFSPSKMYSKDFSNISLDDFTDDMSYDTIDLNDIFKNSATKLLNNYQAGNIRTPEKEVQSILENYDLNNFNDGQKTMAINAVIEGRNAAIAAMNEYERKSQIEAIKANAAEYRAQASLVRAQKSGSNTKVETSKISRTLHDGTTVILTKKGDKYYNDKGVEVTNPDDIDTLDKKSKKYNKSKYARVGTTVYIRKRADGQALTTDNMGTSDADIQNRNMYIDRFNDTKGGDIINNADELIDYINNNATDESLIDAIKTILGTDSDGNIDMGWFVNGKRIIIKKMPESTTGIQYTYGIKIENRPSKKDNSNKDSNQEKNTKQEADNKSEQTENVEPEQDSTEDDEDEEKPIGVD